MRPCNILPAILLGLAFVLPGWADTAAIVKCVAPMTIDGNANDWGYITARYAIRTPAGKPVASFRLAYDDDQLYALFEVLDDSPLKNSADILEELLKGGDAVGIALEGEKGVKSTQRILVAQVNGKPVIVALRPVWPKKRPYTFASPVKTVTMDYVGPVEGARAALREAPGGYTAEIALPWKSLQLQRRKAYRFDAQVILSDPSGTANIESGWWHSKGGDAVTVEDLPTEATLYPDQWGLAREYASDPGPQEAAAGVLTPQLPGVPIRFDIPRDAKVSLVVTDGNGFVVRELLRAEPMVAGSHTIEWDGRDRYDEVLPPGDYRWKLAVFDGMGSRFLGSVGNSARPPYRTADGKGSMGGQHGGASVIAADAHGIYLAGGTEEGHPAMRAIDTEGHTLWKRSMGGFGAGSALATDGESVYVVRMQSRSNEAVLLRLDSESGEMRTIGNNSDGVKIGDAEFGKSLTGMAIVNRHAFFSVASSNHIAVTDLTTGDLLPPLMVAEPQGLARLDEKTVLVCTGSHVCKLDVKSGALSPFITGLDAPRAVAVDPDGRIYVSELGARQQVSRFDATGRLLGRIGVLGGRPLTQDPYDPNSLSNVRGLSVGPENRLWLVESSPLRRVATFTLEGTWVADQFGPVAYNVVGTDLDDLSTVYYQTSQNSPAYVRTKVDYEAYARDPGTPMAAWSVQETMYMTQTGDKASVKEEEKPKDDLMLGAMKPGYGHVVSFTASNGQRYFWRIAKSNRATLPSGAAIWRRDGNRWVPAAFVSNAHKDSQSWSDSNGDGLVQDNERYALPPTRDFAWLDRDLTLYGGSGTLHPTRIDERGVPFYDGGVYCPYLDPGAETIESGWVFSSMPDSDGAVYFAANYGTHRHLSFWDRASENQIIKVANGKIQWIVGQHAAHPSNDSDLTTLSGIAGIVDGIVLAHIVEPARYIAYTTDGLTLGNVIVDESGQSPRVGPNAIYIESFTGLFVKDPTTDKRVLFSVRSGDDPILEITGPGWLSRQEGTIALNSSRPREVLLEGRGTIPYETWWGNNGRGYQIDANISEWLPRPVGFPIQQDGVLIGDIRLRRDAGSLFVLANVRSTSTNPVVNAADISTLWGCVPGVELLMAPANGATDGATQILLACTADKPVAIQRQAGSDDWQRIEEAQVAVCSRWNGYGWRLEAKIPLSALPDALVTETPQTFRRSNKGSSDLVTMHESRLDLKGPIRLNVALHLPAGDQILRLPWMHDKSTSSPESQSDRRWGLVEIR